MGFSFETLVFLAVLAFILFGPEKLPEYAAKLGYYMGKLREASADLSRQYQNPFNYPPGANPAPPLHPSEPSAPLSAPESSCLHCQQTVTSDFIFCPKCGHRLKDSHYPEQPQQSLAS
jgi:hypothetical protein